MNRTHRIAAMGSATLLAFTVLSGTASAQTSPAPAPAFDAAKVCEQRIPKLETRANKLLTRLTGGPEATGSAANLRARAERAKNDAQKDWLNGRAQHRDDRAAQVRKTIDQLNAYKQKHCAK
ncbi:MAG: hypothetical protein ABW215_02185 [Kibdelosporangium sp.]